MVFIINSAPGVGKTTLLRELQDKLHNGFALLDGDDIGRVVPIENTNDWLNLIQDNFVSCCINFKRYEKRNIVIGFVFPSEERIQRLTGLLEREGFDVCHITLFCDDQEVERRIKERNTSKLIGVNKAVELNKKIKELKSDYRFDTTILNKDEVSNRVCDYLLSKKV
jgi:predicted ABC-type ATPase